MNELLAVIVAFYACYLLFFTIKMDNTSTDPVGWCITAVLAKVFPFVGFILFGAYAASFVGIDIPMLEAHYSTVIVVFGCWMLFIGVMMSGSGLALVVFKYIPLVGSVFCALMWGILNGYVMVG